MYFPFVSVIIPTYAREKVLRDTLDDVMRQDYPNFEILVVDQTPIHDPETQTYLANLQTQSKIYWFRVNWASLPRARNYGVFQAAGEIIVFIDDDVRLPKNFLNAHVFHYLEQSDIGAIAGRILAPSTLDNDQERWTIEYLPNEAMDPAIAWYYIDLTHTIQPQQVLTARGCNMSFRREIFQQYGLQFDERFQGSAVREESDFCLRIRQTGYKIWYAPEAVLVHLAEPAGGCHDLCTKTLKYQITHYHNHFWMAFKNLTFCQSLRLFIRLFNCHVLGHPPCHKSGSFVKILVRGAFYLLGFVSAIVTLVQSLKRLDYTKL